MVDTACGFYPSLRTFKFQVKEKTVLTLSFCTHKVHTCKGKKKRSSQAKQGFFIKWKLALK